MDQSGRITAAQSLLRPQPSRGGRGTVVGMGPRRVERRHLGVHDGVESGLGREQPTDPLRRPGRSRCGGRRGDRIECTLHGTERLTTVRTHVRI
jgi:hypothetical protein